MDVIHKENNIVVAYKSNISFFWKVQNNSLFDNKYQGISWVPSSEDEVVLNYDGVVILTRNQTTCAGGGS